MKIVYRTSDYTDALIKKGIIEQAGYLVQMGNQNFGSTEVALGMVDGFTLNVVDDEVEEVTKLLDELAEETAGDHAFEELEGENDQPLPGRGYLPKKGTLLWLAAIILLLFFAY